MGGADRDDKERVKFSSASGEQLLQISAGESHCRVTKREMASHSHSRGQSVENKSLVGSLVGEVGNLGRRVSVPRFPGDPRGRTFFTGSKARR